MEYYLPQELFPMLEQELSPESYKDCSILPSRTSPQEVSSVFLQGLALPSQTVPNFSRSVPYPLIEIVPDLPAEAVLFPHSDYFLLPCWVSSLPPCRDCLVNIVLAMHLYGSNTSCMYIKRMCRTINLCIVYCS